MNHQTPAFCRLALADLESCGHRPRPTVGPSAACYTRNMAGNTNHLKVRCTCCDAVLIVERSSGEVMFAEKPKKKNLSFEDALSSVKKEQETAEDRFKEAFEREQSRRQSVEGKFEEAMKRADELEEPIRPLDFD